MYTSSCCGRDERFSLACVQQQLPCLRAPPLFFGFLPNPVGYLEVSRVKCTVKIYQQRLYGLELVMLMPFLARRVLLLHLALVLLRLSLPTARPRRLSLPGRLLAGVAAYLALRIF